MTLLLESISSQRRSSLQSAAESQIYREVGNVAPEIDCVATLNIASLLELSAIDLILERFEDDPEKLTAMRSCAADAFRLFRVLPFPADPLEAGVQLLRTCALGVLGEMGADASRLLRDSNWENLPIASDDWGQRTWAAIIDVWLRLIRKRGWTDRDLVLERIAQLRDAQSEFENTYLTELDPLAAKAAALELIGLYHLAKAADTLALYITDGVVEGNFQIRQLLDAQFDRAIAACSSAKLVRLEPLARLLSACAGQLAENSIWTVTRAVPTRTRDFVRQLVSRGRGDRALFDVLPPQRQTLAERGLLGSSRRAVVVSLPTSSGKTLIAQFRILQALNQFDIEKGWVAYLAPTRALVNQVTRQMRRDFQPLGIGVEQVSPALEVDAIEMEILSERGEQAMFRVLVTTPEKLDLMLRQDWEAKIERPLTLVVVDEAHNLQDDHRGLQLEMLLSTINKECEQVQFLLLTPFIRNSREVARWLGGQNSDDVSLSLDWQPNDRVIGIVQAKREEEIGRAEDYSISLETVHTSKNTLTTQYPIELGNSPEIASKYRDAKQQMVLAALAAQDLQKRGPVIVMHARPDWVWSLAGKLKIPANRTPTVSDRVSLVQDYLRLELGESFPLIDLLRHGIAVHHAGLPDDVRALVEWLFESNELRFLVATTTVAQGVNFPVSGVVMASHRYVLKKNPFWKDMPPEDFWNIAGRAGRVGHGQLGVVLLAAENDEKAVELRRFITSQAGDLNSALVTMALSSQGALGDLERIVYNRPEWSSFLQYLAHTYRQMGRPDSFVTNVEQVLRGTFGFEKLRSQHPGIARELLVGISSYCAYLRRPNQPLKLVDSTGFSLQSVNTVLTNRGNIDERSWNSETLFRPGDPTLRDMMGILLRVPELRENLIAATGGPSPDGNKLAAIVKDWVNGESIPTIAERHFRKEGDSPVTALTKCGQNLFGKISQTASWGLGALLSITGAEIPDENFKELTNLPSRVFYGVNSDAAIVLRLLGVPRTAAASLARSFPEARQGSISVVREHLSQMDSAAWSASLGESGAVYRKVWRVLEGLD